MSTGEDEPSSGLNGRLRPRKSNASSPQNTHKTSRRPEGKGTQDRPNRTVTPSKSSPNKLDDTASKSDSSSTPNFLCLYCDKKFGSKPTLSQHTSRVHVSASKPDSLYECIYCEHNSTGPNDVIRHMVESHPNQYFACLDCQTRFSSTPELAEHKLNVCEKQKLFRNKNKTKTSPGPKSKKNHKVNTNEFETDNKEFPDDSGFNGIVISCELKPSEVHDEDDIEGNITTNLILPPNKNIVPGNILEKNAVIVLDDIQWNKRIPPNFTFHNTDADQILSRLGVVHRSPRAESNKRDWLQTKEESAQLKFERCFDTRFYSRVASNVQENLTKFLDGSFNFNPDADSTIKTRKSKNNVVINTAEGFPILLAGEQFSRNVVDGSYLPRAVAPKHKWKWDSLENEKATPTNPDQMKRDSHINNCIITLVSSLDIWTQLCMRRKFEEIYNIPESEKIDKHSSVDNELKEILESREIPSSLSQPLQPSTQSAPPLSSEDGSNFPASLGLVRSAPVRQVEPVVLSGESVRPRCYVCCACGSEARDAKSLTSHISTQHPNAQVQHYEIVGELLLNADILKHLYVPPSQVSNRTRPMRGFRECTKCQKSVTLEELHQHMLDCAGDTPTVRRKCRYRPFGVRRRRPRLPDNTIRRQIRKDMRNRQGRQKPHIRPRPKIRTEVGDAETIRRMLADLPAKRHRPTASSTNSSSRLRAKLDKKRNKIIMQRRASSELKLSKLRVRKERNNPTTSTAAQVKSIRKNEQPRCRAATETEKTTLRPKVRRVVNTVTFKNKPIKKKGLIKKPRKKIANNKDAEEELPVVESDAGSTETNTASTSNNSQEDNLSIGHSSRRVDVNKSPYNTRDHASRGGSNNRDHQRPGCSGSNSNARGPNAPAQNVPLKHSIARLTANSETHDKSVQFHQMFLVQQECNNVPQHHVPTGHQLLFENEAVVTKLDKPPLICTSGTFYDAYSKGNKNNKPRKGLNDCIAMLKNKLHEPAPLGPGLVSVQCGSDDPLDNEPIPLSTLHSNLSCHDTASVQTDAELQTQSADERNDVKIDREPSKRTIVSRKGTTINNDKKTVGSHETATVSDETVTVSDATSVTIGGRNISGDKTTTATDKSKNVDDKKIVTSDKNTFDGNKATITYDNITHSIASNTPIIVSETTTIVSDKMHGVGDETININNDRITSVGDKATMNIDKSTVSNCTDPSQMDISKPNVSESRRHSTRRRASKSVKEISQVKPSKGQVPQMLPPEINYYQAYKGFPQQITENKIHHAKELSPREVVPQTKDFYHKRHGSKQNRTTKISQSNSHQQETSCISAQVNSGHDKIMESVVAQQTQMAALSHLPSQITIEVNTAPPKSRERSYTRRRSSSSSTSTTSSVSFQKHQVERDVVEHQIKAGSQHLSDVTYQKVLHTPQNTELNMLPSEVALQFNQIEHHLSAIEYDPTRKGECTYSIIALDIPPAHLNPNTDVVGFIPLDLSGKPYTQQGFEDHGTVYHESSYGGFETLDLSHKSVDNIHRERLIPDDAVDLSLKSTSQYVSTMSLHGSEEDMNEVTDLSFKRPERENVPTDLSIRVKEKSIMYEDMEQYGGDFSGQRFPPARSFGQEHLELPDKNVTTPKGFDQRGYDVYAPFYAARPDLISRELDLSMQRSKYAREYEKTDLSQRHKDISLNLSKNNVDVDRNLNQQEFANIDNAEREQYDRTVNNSPKIKSKNNGSEVIGNISENLQIADSYSRMYKDGLEGAQPSISESNCLASSDYSNMRSDIDESEQPTINPSSTITNYNEVYLTRRNSLSTTKQNKLLETDKSHKECNEQQKKDFINDRPTPEFHLDKRRTIKNTYNCELLKDTPAASVASCSKTSELVNESNWKRSSKSPTPVCNDDEKNTSCSFPSLSKENVQDPVIKTGTTSINQDDLTFKYDNISSKPIISTISTTIPAYNLANMSVTTHQSHSNKYECTTPVYTLTNSCISVTRIENSHSVTLTNNLLSIPSATITNTTSVYTLAGTTIGLPTNYVGSSTTINDILPTSDNKLLPESPEVQILDKVENPSGECGYRKSSLIKTVAESSADKSHPGTSEQDDETARKIALLPKEIVEILGNMPIDHRNQLLNVLPQYVTVSSSGSTTKCAKADMLTTSPQMQLNSKLSADTYSRPSPITVENSQVNIKRARRSSTKTTDECRLSTQEKAEEIEIKNNTQHLYDSTPDVETHKESKLYARFNSNEDVKPIDINVGNKATQQVLVARIIDLTEEDSSDAVKGSDNDLSHSPSKSQEVTDVSVTSKLSRQKSNSEQTASLRAVRIKTPSERRRSTSKQLNSKCKDDNIDTGTNADDTKKISLKQSLAIQQAEISSTQHNKNNSTESKVISSVSTLDLGYDTNVRQSSSSSEILRSYKSSDGVMSNTSSQLVLSSEQVAKAPLVSSSVSNINKNKESVLPQELTDDAKIDVTANSLNSSSESALDNTLNFNDKAVRSSTPKPTKNKLNRRGKSEKVLEAKSEAEDDSDDDVTLAVIVKQKHEDLKVVFKTGKGNTHVKSKHLMSKDQSNTLSECLVKESSTEPKEGHLNKNAYDVNANNESGDFSVEEKPSPAISLHSRTHKKRNKKLRNNNTISEDTPNSQISNVEPKEHDTLHTTETLPNIVKRDVVIRNKTEVHKISNSDTIEKHDKVIVPNPTENKQHREKSRRMKHDGDGKVGDKIDSICSKDVPEECDVVYSTCDQDVEFQRNLPSDEMNISVERASRRKDNNLGDPKDNDDVVSLDSPTCIVKPLRRSRRGKSLFITRNTPENNVDERERTPEHKIPLTKKQLIFSKLLLDEENLNKSSVTEKKDKVTETSIVKSHHICESPSEPESSTTDISKELDNDKSVKRKKIPDKSKSKKKKLIGKVDLNNGTHLINEKQHESDQFPNEVDVTKELPTETTQINHLSSKKEDAICDSIIPVKLTNSAEKRKNLIGESSQSTKAKKLKRNGKRNKCIDFKLNADDIRVKKVSKTSGDIEPRTCYNLPAASRRTRSKSVATSSVYDPYDIDLEEMNTKPKEIYQHPASSDYSATSKDNVEKETKKKSKLIKSQKSRASSKLDSEKSRDDKNNLSDSDESSKSDVPLKKYVQEKEKKGVKKDTSQNEDSKDTSQKNITEADAQSTSKSSERISQSERDERSEQFMESFGFFSERKPRKSNLLASKKISETFHIIATENDDTSFGHQNRSAKKVPENDNKDAQSSSKSPQSSKSKKNMKRIRNQKTSTKIVPSYCRICKKEFRRSDNILRHQMTLLHIAKLSEVEMKVNTIPILEEPNYLIAYKQQIDRVKMLKCKIAKRKRSSKPKSKIKLPTLEQILCEVYKSVREQQLSRRNLSRDEALFLDCCELLKESHLTNEMAQARADSTLNTGCNSFACNITNAVDSGRSDNRSDGDVDSITAKNILESEEVRNLENDLISGLKEAANANALNASYQQAGLIRNTCEDPDVITKSFRDFKTLEDQVKKIEPDIPDDQTPKKLPEIKEKMYPDVIENIDMFEDKFDKIKRKSRSQAVAAKQTPITVDKVISHKGRKKAEKRKGKKKSKKIRASAILTKAALKGFDGIKVSIPTSDINMPAIVNSSDTVTKKKKKTSSKKKREKRNSETSQNYDGKQAKDNDTSQTKLDVYEFMDNEDVELFEFRPSTLMERFKSISNKDMPSTSKCNSAPKEPDNTSESVSDGDDFVYMSDDYLCSDEETENSLSTETSNGKISNDLRKNTSMKRRDVIEKNAVMGKIFKNNAVRNDKKAIKEKESCKSKTNLDQLFDSLLENDPSSSIVNSDTTSPEVTCNKKDGNLRPMPSTSSPPKHSLCLERTIRPSTSAKSPSPLPNFRVYDYSSLKNEPSTSKAPDVVQYCPSASQYYDDTSSSFDDDSSSIKTNQHEITSPKEHQFPSPKKTDSKFVKNLEIQRRKFELQEKTRLKASFEHPSTSYDYIEPDSTEEPGVDATGVAPQRARRKCTVGKQNVLTETWSSESEPDGQPPRPNSAESTVPNISRKKKGKRREVQQASGRRINNRHISFKRHDMKNRVSSGNRSVMSSSEGGRVGRASHDTEDSSQGSSGPTPSCSHAVSGPSHHGSLGTAASKVRPRSTASYWLTENEEEPEHPQQHGWIVGDSHKKLVTMLAHAKGRKRSHDDKRHSAE